MCKLKCCLILYTRVISYSCGRLPLKDFRFVPFFHFSIDCALFGKCHLRCTLRFFEKSWTVNIVFLHIFYEEGKRVNYVMINIVRHDKESITSWFSNNEQFQATLTKWVYFLIFSLYVIQTELRYTYMYIHNYTPGEPNGFGRFLNMAYGRASLMMVRLTYEFLGFLSIPSR